jgi:hypothetical protein
MQKSAIWSAEANRKAKPKGVDAHVASLSVAGAEALRPPSSEAGGARNEGAPTQRPPSEWRGNVLLVMAVAVLVAVATFVMVRERLAEGPRAVPRATAR